MAERGKSKPWAVFVSMDGGNTWALDRGEPVHAGNRDAACQVIRDRSPELKGRDDVEFFATRDFVPRRKVKQLVEAWSWVAPGEEPTREQATLEDAPADG